MGQGSSCLASLDPRSLSPQLDWFYWVPNAPCTMRLPPPTTKDATMEKLMATLPDPHQSTLQINVIWLLGRRQAVMVRVSYSGSRGWIQRGSHVPSLNWSGSQALSCFPLPCIPGASGPAFRGTLLKPRGQSCADEIQRGAGCPGRGN